MSVSALDSEEDITIRALLPSDAKQAAELSAELGYPMPIDAMAARLSQFAEMESHIVFGACLQSNILGWIDVGIVHHLQSQPYGEVGGLIVSSNYRGRGVGKKLVRRAEAWIAAQGVTKLLVRSNINREAAHRFYLQQDFSRVKTSAVFAKSVGELLDLDGGYAAGPTPMILKSE